MKAEQDLPVAVRVTDKHGQVTVVRITPAGNAFFHQVLKSKGRTRGKDQFPVESLPTTPPTVEELEQSFRDVRRPARVFLDEIGDEAQTTYCSRGKHDVELPIADMREAASRFKGGAPTATLTV
jgi:hypothetical protein